MIDYYLSVSHIACKTVEKFCLLNTEDQQVGHILQSQWRRHVWHKLKRSFIAIGRFSHSRYFLSIKAKYFVSEWLKNFHTHSSTHLKIHLSCFWTSLPGWRSHQTLASCPDVHSSTVSSAGCTLTERSLDWPQGGTEEEACTASRLYLHHRGTLELCVCTCMWSLFWWAPKLLQLVQRGTRM